MPSQFFKRKAKSEEVKNVSPEVVETVEEVVAPEATVEANYTQTALDIFTPDGGRHYKVAEIGYNPETGQAEVREIFNITRLVALQYQNTKVALGTLKKKAIKD